MPFSLQEARLISNPTLTKISTGRFESLASARIRKAPGCDKMDGTGYVRVYAPLRLYESKHKAGTSAKSVGSARLVGRKI